MTRCFGDGDDLYAEYHDTEWGIPPPNFGAHEAELFERLSLEVFQVGLSWILILRRRREFRLAFAGFDPLQVSQFTDEDVETLAQNPGIVRNRSKIKATVSNAAALLRMHEEGETLAELIAAHRPPTVVGNWPSLEQVPAFTPESEALAKALKARGFKFIGPTNVYAMMQALGVVNDHAATCPVGKNNPEDSQRPADVWDEVSERTASEG